MADGKHDMPCFGEFNPDQAQCIFCPDHDSCERTTNNKFLNGTNVPETKTPRVLGDDPRMQGPGPTA